MNEALLFWGFGLLAAALLLIVIEVFVPSGGLISVGAGIAAIGGIVMLFRYDVTWGLTGILVVMVLGPAVFGFALRVWPSTPLGRKMLGERTIEQVEAEREAVLRERSRMSALIGAEGIAATDFRPVGILLIEGERLEALSEVGFVPSGTKIRVTTIESNQIKVRPVA